MRSKFGATYLIHFKGFEQQKINYIHIKGGNEKLVRLGRTFFWLNNLFYVFQKAAATEEAK